MADGGERELRDVGVLADGYERLRATALAGGAGAWRLGHQVLRARGMAGWIGAFGALCPPAAGAAADGAGLGPASAPAGAAARAERVAALPGSDRVVAVLAQMVLPLAA